jgi:hypothetical protein
MIILANFFSMVTDERINNFSAPWPFKSLDLNSIEHLWMTWIDACAVVNQRRKLYKNCSRFLSKNGGELRKTVFVDR